MNKPWQGRINRGGGPGATSGVEAPATLLLLLSSKK